MLHVRDVVASALLAVQVLFGLIVLQTLLLAVKPLCNIFVGSLILPVSYLTRAAIDSGLILEARVMLTSIRLRTLFLVWFQHKNVLLWHSDGFIESTDRIDELFGI